MSKSLISIRDFTKEEILHVLETAKEFEQNKEQKFLEGKVIASLFFEPSTRTRLSFEAAMYELGNCYRYSWRYSYGVKEDKKELFESWGYSIIDSENLQQEFVKQAKLTYSVGDYELDRLDDYGQRINIEIKLKRKDKAGYVTFQSGWMVYPDGKIILTTPYGDK